MTGEEELVLPTSIIEGVRDYLRDYTGLSTDAPVWVEYLGNTPTEYALLPLAGSRTIVTYINGKRLMEYPFAFRSMESTADDLARLENNGFYEAFAEWLDEQTNDGDLPNLPEGKTAEAIEALGWGYLYEQGDSETGVYQVQCRLIYEQDEE
jgi:hypothetical protein